MSLLIEIDKVSEVLLSGKWYTVLEDSFDLDAYEFIHERLLLVSGKRGTGVCSTGFTFRSSLGRIVGPLTAISAVKIKQ